jgi:coenzyme F420 hydrogenase subunit beta
VNEEIRKEESNGLLSVINHGYCVGCGVCAAQLQNRIQMVETQYGTFEPVILDDLDAQDLLKATLVCPFSDLALNENILANELYGNAITHDHIGRYVSTYACRVTESEYRLNGSSGGMGTWLLDSLLRGKYVDGVVHVVRDTESSNNLLYKYKVSRSVKDIHEGSKSKYYPVRLDEVIKEVLDKPGRYAFIGVPCFIKAIRLFAKHNPLFNKSVRFCIGLVCGHLKTKGYVEFLAWQMGVKPNCIMDFDFRVKQKDKPANKYAVRVRGQSDVGILDVTKPMVELFGNDWGLGLFKLKACDFCDDVVAETADIVIGDAWLPQFTKDSLGTNIVITRNDFFDKLIKEAMDSSSLESFDLSPDDVVKSQGSGFTHRREGLAYRLAYFDKKGLWRPLKREFGFVNVFDNEFEKKHELRMNIAEKCHVAFLEAKKNNDINIFFLKIMPVTEKYYDVSRSSVRIILSRFKYFIVSTVRHIKVKLNNYTVW